MKAWIKIEKKQNKRKQVTSKEKLSKMLKPQLIESNTVQQAV